MKSLTSLKLLKSLGIALLFVGVAPLLPVIALMHWAAWMGGESSAQQPAIQPASNFRFVAR